MSAFLKPGSTAEIAGPKKALLISKPSVAASMIKRAKRVLLVIGSKSTKTQTIDGDLIDSVARLSKTHGMDIAVTGHLIGEFRKRGIENTYSMSIMSVGERLRDPEWNGLDGSSPYDLVIFLGHLYYMAWLVLNGLKHFAPHLTTMSLGASYQPNAGWSTGSISEEKWKTEFNTIIESLEEA